MDEFPHSDLCPANHNEGPCECHVVKIADLEKQRGRELEIHGGELAGCRERIAGLEALTRVEFGVKLLQRIAALEAKLEKRRDGKVLATATKNAELYADHEKLLARNTQLRGALEQVAHAKNFAGLSDGIRGMVSAALAREERK